MNILIIGYGKMGKMVEQVAKERGHTIGHIMDYGDNFDDVDFSKVDIAIDFSSPEFAVDNIIACFNKHLPIIMGTTGWYNRLQELKDLANKEERGLFVASNFSIGMFIFNKINSQLASLMNSQPLYEVGIEETHHKHKLDSPSGTAITLAETILNNIDRKSSWLLEHDKGNFIDEKKDDTLYIRSIREGEVIGTHTINYSSEIDDIEITHKAHNRKGFALGAVLAAEFMIGKKGFYQMSDMIK